MENRIGKVFYCTVCGNEVEFVKDSGTPIICCGKEMVEKEEKKEEME